MSVLSFIPVLDWLRYDSGQTSGYCERWLFVYRMKVLFASAVFCCFFLVAVWGFVFRFVFW